MCGFVRGNGLSRFCCSPKLMSKEHHFEFMGPHGPIVMMLGLPVTCYGIYFLCNANGCFHLFPLE